MNHDWLDDSLTQCMFNTDDCPTDRLENLSDKETFIGHNHAIKKGCADFFQTIAPPQTARENIFTSNPEPPAQAACETVQPLNSWARETKLLNWNHIKDPHELINLRGHQWKAFTGFWRITNTRHPLGPFAPRCHRCSSYPVWRNLITCFIMTSINNQLRNIMTDLCHNCFWLYRESQIKTCRTMSVSDEFIQYMYSEENIRRAPQVLENLRESYGSCNFHEPRPPEYDVYIRGYDTPTYFSIFNRPRYPWVPPKAMRHINNIIPPYQPGEILEGEDIQIRHAQLVATLEIIPDAFSRNAKRLKRSDPALYLN